MNFSSIYKKVRQYAYSLVLVGVDKSAPIYLNQRITYFNTILLAMPVVYACFVLYDVQGYFKPLSDWYFDQYSFFIFSAICLICLFLNRFNWSSLSKMLFLILWPVVQHIIPIIVQNTPTDYYFAFPIGLIFHSLMIQVIYSSKYSTIKFVLLMIVNLVMTLHFLDFLQYYDTEGGSELAELAHGDYYVLVVFLYWLLFNLIIFYIMRVIENNLVKITEGHKKVEEQKVDLENAMQQLKQSNELVIQSEKMASLGVFTAGIAHELNNPMNFIGSGTVILFNHLNSLKEQVLKSNPELEIKFDELEKARAAIDIGVTKSSKIVSSLKNYARVDQENHAKNDLVNSIRDALLLIPANLKNKVKIVESLPSQLTIVCSQTKMTQVFVNLIQNAIDASPQNGEVLLKAANQGDVVIIEIQDQGDGISEKDQGKIFDPFFTTKEVGQGTGLGLYIVHDIVKEHQGTLTFESKVNEGTKFTITLPIG